MGNDLKIGLRTWLWLDILSQMTMIDFSIKLADKLQSAELIFIYDMVADSWLLYWVSNICEDDFIKWIKKVHAKRSYFVIYLSTWNSIGSW